MTLGLHNLKKAKGSTKNIRRVGRGHGTGRGKTAGRGTKGQSSRTGGSKGLKLMGLRRMVMSIPKARGFSRFSATIKELTLWDINRYFTDGGTVNSETLLAKNLILAGGKAKILNTGKLERRDLKVSGIVCSKGARVEIEKLNGTVN